MPGVTLLEKEVRGSYPGMFFGFNSASPQTGLLSSTPSSPPALGDLAGGSLLSCVKKNFQKLSGIWGRRVDF